MQARPASIPCELECDVRVVQRVEGVDYVEWCGSAWKRASLFGRLVVAMASEGVEQTMSLALYAPKIALAEATSLKLKPNTAAEKYPGQ
jgi:hypothetical protein